MIPTSHDERAPRVLVADDDADVLAALKLLLRGEGFEVETATSPAQALAALEARDFDVALLDLNYARDTTSGREGLELLEQLRALDPTLPVVVMTAWGGALVCVGLAIERAVRPMQTIANMMAAIREGDTSIRARHADPEGALGLALFEINALTESVRRHRLGALAATTLLQRVMDAVDVAVFGFDAERRLRLVNGEGERLLGRPAERALGLEAAWLGLGSAFEGDTPRLLELRLGGAAGRWELRRGDYIQDGRPHVLLLLSDLSRALREEEREAWLRLIRVLSHEINNSLAPIQSIAGSLRTMIARGASTPEESSEGLQIIETRAQSLGRFMHAYARLARLPKPLLAPVDVPAWVAHGAALETRLAVEVLGGPAVRVDADRDQLDQAAHQSGAQCDRCRSRDEWPRVAGVGSRRGFRRTVRPRRGARRR